MNSISLLVIGYSGFLFIFAIVWEYVFSEEIVHLILAVKFLLAHIVYNIPLDILSDVCKICYELSHVSSSPKFVCWRPNPQHRQIQLHLEIGL